jgi:hypothetical protein
VSWTVICTGYSVLNWTLVKTNISRDPIVCTIKSAEVYVNTIRVAAVSLWGKLGRCLHLLSIFLAQNLS